MFNKIFSKVSKLKKSSLAKEALVYGFTNALYSAMPLLLLPFMVTVLSPEDYGIMDLFRTVSLVLTPILGLSTVQSIARFYYDQNETDFKSFVSTVIIFHFIMAGAGALVLLAFGFLLEEKYILLSYLAILFFLFGQVTEALLTIYRVKKSVNKYLMLRLGSVVLDLVLLFVFYRLFTTYDWTYRIFPNVIATVVVGAFSIFFLLKSGYPLIFKSIKLKQALLYSAPLILHMLSGYVLNLGDRFFILHFLDAEEVGRYAVAYQLGMAVNFFYTSFNLAWTPTFFELMKKRNYALIKKVEKLILIIIPGLGGLVVLFFLLANKLIPSLQNYKISIGLVLIISLSYIIFSYYKYYANFFLYNKKTKQLSLITLLSSVVCILLNVILIPALGIMGAAVSTLVSFFVLLIFVKLKVSYEKDIS